MSAAANAPAEAAKMTAEKLGRYLHRLPLLTRAVVVGVIGVYLLDAMGAPVTKGFRLDPKVMGLDQSEFPCDGFEQLRCAVGGAGGPRMQWPVRTSIRSGRPRILEQLINPQHSA